MNIQDVKVGMNITSKEGWSARLRGTAKVTWVGCNTFKVAGFDDVLDPRYYEAAETQPIPEVPFGELTADQKVQLVSAGIRGEAIEQYENGMWVPKMVFGTQSSSLLRFRAVVIYRIKPQETPEELEIKSIREQMQTLTDRLAKLESK